MYRQYENPYELEQELVELEAELAEAWNEGMDESYIIDLEIARHELKDRIAQAWEDDEYESELYE